MHNGIILNSLEFSILKETEQSLLDEFIKLHFDILVIVSKFRTQNIYSICY